MQVFRTADRQPTRWRNGGGITFEVASFPAGSGLGDFLWRISMAEVTQSGAFSVFPNVDRTLAIIEGRLLLDTAGQGIAVLDQQSPALTFSGDVLTVGTPVSEVVKDLNVMTRRGQFSATVNRYAVLGTDSRLVFKTDVSVIIALSDIRIKHEHIYQELRRHDAILITKAENEEVELGKPLRGEGLEFFLVELRATSSNLDV
jgi:environmental stress-induced protein Ves